MPAFNRAGVLRTTINQVLNQTFSDFELIIFNDGSSDETSAVVRGFADDRILFIDSPVNIGPPRPLNAILARARGEYIIVLHDHDFFDPSLLERTVHVLDKNPSVGFVLPGSGWVDEDGSSHYRPMLLGLPTINRGFDCGAKMLADRYGFNSKFHACSLVRRKALEHVGMFYDERFGLYSDTDLWLRLMREFDFAYIDEVLLIFRERERHGHFLDRKRYETATALLRIHETNIHRYFPREARFRDSLLRRAKYKWQYEIVRNAAHYLVTGEEQLFVDGVVILQSQTKNVVARAAFMLSLNSPACRCAIRMILKLGRRLRSLIRPRGAFV